MESLFISTPFRMAAILHLTSQPAAFRYNPHNLGAVLHNLHPRPKVIILGAAISPTMTTESIVVWDTYVEEAKEDGTLVINVLVPIGVAR